MNTVPKLLLGATLACALNAVPAHALASRTWVSGNGDDMNPCSYTAPCKTLAGAITKTSPGGEISIMDADAVGAVTITKAITINGEGTLGSVLVANGSGIVVNAGATDKVILRNLSINGTPGGSVGINLLSGNLTVDKCFIYGFLVGFVGGSGINVTTQNGGKLDVRDTNITNSSFGISMTNSTGNMIATMDNVRINDVVGYGIGAWGNNVFATVNRSFVSSAGIVGIYANSTNGAINVENSALTNNTVAVHAALAGVTIRLNNNSIYNNSSAYMIAAGATIATANNNKTGSNGGVTVPNGMVVVQ